MSATINIITSQIQGS